VERTEHTIEIAPLLRCRRGLELLEEARKTLSVAHDSFDGALESACYKLAIALARNGRSLEAVQ